MWKKMYYIHTSATRLLLVVWRLWPVWSSSSIHSISSFSKYHSALVWNFPCFSSLSVHYCNSKREISCTGVKAGDHRGSKLEITEGSKLEISCTGIKVHWNSEEISCLLLLVRLFFGCWAIDTFKSFPSVKHLSLQKLVTYQHCYSEEKISYQICSHTNLCITYLHQCFADSNCCQQSVYSLPSWGKYSALYSKKQYPLWRKCTVATSRIPIPKGKRAVPPNQGAKRPKL